MRRRLPARIRQLLGQRPLRVRPRGITGSRTAESDRPKQRLARAAGASHYIRNSKRLSSWLRQVRSQVVSPTARSARRSSWTSIRGRVTAPLDSFHVQPSIGPCISSTTVQRDVAGRQNLCRAAKSHAKQSDAERHSTAYSSKKEVLQANRGINEPVVQTHTSRQSLEPRECDRERCTEFWDLFK